MPQTDYATIGLGATISVNDGSGGAGSASALILDVISINPPDATVQTIERKPVNLTSRTIVKFAGLQDPGEFSFQYEYSAGKKTRIDSLKGQDRVFVIVIPDAGDGTAYTKTVPGFISANKMDSVTSDGLVTVTATVVVRGPVS